MLKYLFLLTICSVNLYGMDIHNLINSAVKNSSIYKIEKNKLLIHKNNIDISKDFLTPKSLYLNSNIYGSLEGTVSYSIGPKLSYELLNTKNSVNIKKSNLQMELMEIEFNRKTSSLFNYYYSLLLDILYNQKLYNLNKEELQSREEYNKNIEERFKSRELSISEYTYSLSTILIYREDEKETKEKLEESIILFEIESGIKIEDFNKIEINFDSLVQNENIQVEKFNILKQISEIEETDKLDFRLDANSGISYPFDNNSWNIGLNFYLDLPSSKKLKKENKENTLINIKTEEEDFLKNNESKISSINKNIKSSLERLQVYIESIGLLEQSLEGVIIESKSGEATSFDVILFQNRILELKKDVINIEYEIENYKLNRIFLNGGFTLDE